MQTLRQQKTLKSSSRTLERRFQSLLLSRPVCLVLETGDGDDSNKSTVDESNELHQDLAQTPVMRTECTGAETNESILTLTPRRLICYINQCTSSASHSPLSLLPTGQNRAKFRHDAVVHLKTSST